MATVSGAAGGRGPYYYGWNIVAVCILAAIAGNALIINAFSLFLKDWSEAFHAPISTLTLGIAACGLLCALLAPFVGVIVDKYPTRIIFAIGLALVALFCIGVSFVERTWQLIALYASIGPISLMLTTSLPANSVVSRWFVKRLGLALGLTAFGLGMGGVIMPPLIAAIMPDLGWRAIWRAGGVIIGVIVLPLIVGVLRDRPTAREGLHYVSGGNGAPAQHGHGGGDAGRGVGTRDILTSRNFWLMVIVYLPMLALYGGANQNLAPLAASRGLGTQAASVLLSIFSLAQLASTLLVGILSDRFGNRLPLIGLAVVTAAGGVILTFGQGVAAIGLGALCAGCGGSFWPLLAAASAREFGAAGVGRAFGMLSFFLPAAVLSPFFVAKAQESTGSYAPALLTMAAVAILGGLLCLLMREKPKIGAVDGIAAAAA